ncbi:MAG: hypothetical protein LBL83_13225, partial [Clostridiales bacterium]|nr:hypothetical protein [Clostridiales bacterium]
MGSTDENASPIFSLSFWFIALIIRRAKYLSTAPHNAARGERGQCAVRGMCDARRIECNLKALLQNCVLRPCGHNGAGQGCGCREGAAVFRIDSQRIFPGQFVIDNQRISPAFPRHFPGQFRAVRIRYNLNSCWIFEPNQL